MYTITVLTVYRSGRREVVRHFMNTLPSRASAHEWIERNPWISEIRPEHADIVLARTVKIVKSRAK